MTCPEAVTTLSGCRDSVRTPPAIIMGLEILLYDFKFAADGTFILLVEDYSPPDDCDISPAPFLPS